MIIIQHKDNKVVDILRAREDATIDNIAVVESIPTFEPKEGYSGELRYSAETGLYWEYIEHPPIDEQEISNAEFGKMVEEVL